MTEYIDNFSLGRPITVTTKQTILSGEITRLDEENGVIEFVENDEQYRVKHVGGDLRSDDSTGDFPEYEIQIEDEWVPVRDLRHGEYALG